MQNAGQTCTSTERVYVEEPIYDDFVRLVADRVGELRQGAPGGPGSMDLGAVISPPQSDIVERHVNDAVEHGARVLVGGGRRDENGHFFEPTVLVDVDHSMACMREETFGPTVPIMKVRDAEEAVRLANDTPYGLQASVWTKDAAKGERLARRIEAGAVTVNDAQVNYVALELPMGGWKESGLGTRHGADGIRKYTKKQSVLVTNFAPMKKDLHMMPYSERRTASWRGCSSWSTGADGRLRLGGGPLVSSSGADRGSGRRRVGDRQRSAHPSGLVARRGPDRGAGAVAEGDEYVHTAR